MPSFSLAMSRMRRLVADWEISISDFGDWCCEAGMRAIHQMKEKREGGSRNAARLCEPRLDGDAGRLRPFAGFDLFAVGGLHPGDLEAPVGTDHGEAIRFHRRDVTGLAGDALGVLRGQWLGVENLKLLAVERRPGAGCGVAAADEPVDLLPGLAPVDLGVVGPAAAFVGRLGFVLLEARRLAGLYEVDGF